MRRFGVEVSAAAAERELVVKVREAVYELEAKLREAGIAAARAEAEWLLAEAVGTTRTELYLREEPLDPQAVETIQAWCARRLRGEPLQYVLGCCWFAGQRLRVRPGAFIPRPETEVLVEQAIGFLERWLQQGRGEPCVLDAGTGSANIAVSLARAIAACRVVAVELSWEVLQIARANMQALGVADRVQLLRADWTSAVRGQFALVVSNPPYVPREELTSLPPEVGWEPRMSLDGGADGMDAHRRLLEEAPRLLRSGGAIGFECDPRQAAALLRLAKRQPWVAHAVVYDDLAGRPRGLFIHTR